MPSSVTSDSGSARNDMNQLDYLQNRLKYEYFNQ